jgi:hypothetical protein
MPSYIVLRLSNGDEKKLVATDAPGEALQRFVSRAGPYQSDWLEADDGTMVCRAHVVVALVQSD